MKVDTCHYCNYKELLSPFGFLAFETDTSLIIVFRDQTHKGRVIVTYKKDHVSELQFLSLDERNKFMDDVVKTSQAIQKAFNPDRINLAAYNDTLGHLHFHLVPKYKDGVEWGQSFTMNNGSFTSDEECLVIANKIKESFGF